MDIYACVCECGWEGMKEVIMEVFPFVKYLSLIILIDLFLVILLFYIRKIVLTVNCLISNR